MTTKQIFTSTAICLLTISSAAQSQNFNVCVYDFCSEAGVENISVQLKPGQEAEQWLFTGVNGCATFATSAVPAGVTLQVSLHAAIDPLSGVNMLDVNRFQKHLSGEQPFTEPYQWLAADVNRDHAVDSTDLSLLVQMMLGTFTQFPDGNARIFFPVEYVFAHPEMPMLDTLPEMPFTAINGQTDYLGLYSVTLGKVNLSGCSTTSVLEQQNTINADIFPNPVSDILHIRTPDSLSDKKITLTDILGKVALTTTALDIPVDQLPVGVYLLRISSNNRQVFTSRVQVVH